MASASCQGVLGASVTGVPPLLPSLPLALPLLLLLLPPPPPQPASVPRAPPPNTAPVPSSRERRVRPAAGKSWASSRGEREAGERSFIAGFAGLGMQAAGAPIAQPGVGTSSDVIHV